MSEIEKKSLISIRKMVEGDKNCIRSTWVKRLKWGKYWNDDQQGKDSYWFHYHNEEIEQDTFFRNYQKIIEHVLNKPGVSISVACLREDPDVILGYAVMEGPATLHWVYVKKDWRGIGLARDLVPSTIKTVTHLTRDGLKIKRKHKLFFDPFLI